MSIIQVAKIQHRSGNIIDLPQLDTAEFGLAIDTANNLHRLFIGPIVPVHTNTSPISNNIEILTVYSTFANLVNGYSSVRIPAPNSNIYFQVNGSNTVLEVGSNTIGISVPLVSNVNGNRQDSSYVPPVVLPAPPPPALNTPPFNVTSTITVANLFADGAERANVQLADTATPNVYHLTFTSSSAEQYSANNSFYGDKRLWANNNLTYTVAANGVVTLGLVGEQFIEGNLIVTNNFAVGNVTASDITAANFFVSGNLVYVNVENLMVEDTYIELAKAGNGVVAPDMYDRGMVMNYQPNVNSTQKFIGWDSSNNEAVFLSNVVWANTSNLILNTSASDFGNVRTGNLLLQHSNLHTVSTTFNLANANATTINFGGAADIVNIGNATGNGNTTILNNFVSNGNMTVNSTVDSTSTTTGALVIGGGVGIAKNVHIGANANVAGNINTVGNVISNAQFISTIANGTPPLQVNSVDRVSNLYVQGSNESNIQSQTAGTFYLNFTAANAGGGVAGNLVHSANTTMYVDLGPGASGTPPTLYAPRFSGNFAAPGSNTQVLYNDGGNIAAAPSLTFNNTNGSVGVSGSGPATSNTSIAALTIPVGGIAVDQGNIWAGGQLAANIVTGTAPLVVQSTTRVTNLRVEGSNVSNIQTPPSGVVYVGFANNSTGGESHHYTSSNVSFDTASGELSIPSLTVSGLTDLGDIGNLTITGGSAGNVIITDGLGGLTWGTPSAILGNALSFSSTGNGTTSPDTYDGSAVKTISWNTFGAASGNAGGWANVGVGPVPISNIQITGGSLGNVMISDGAGGFTWGTPSATLGNVLSFSDTGNGVSSPDSFNGTATKTISYNTVGAAKSAGTNYYAVGISNAGNTTGMNPDTGNIYGAWTLAAGATLQATYADLAEYYVADAHYEPGTVLEFGGTHEVTLAEDETARVAGVVSTNPAYGMNANCKGEHVVALALQGRVPCKVRGVIHKGDMMVSGGSGYARPTHSPKLGTIIGKALQDFSGEGVIEIAVGRL